jgi:hypothetical protein
MPYDVRGRSCKGIAQRGSSLLAEEDVREIKPAVVTRYRLLKSAPPEVVSLCDRSLKIAVNHTVVYHARSAASQCWTDAKQRYAGEIATTLPAWSNKHPS